MNMWKAINPRFDSKYCLINYLTKEIYYTGSYEHCKKLLMRLYKNTKKYSPEKTCTYSDVCGEDVRIDGVSYTVEPYSNKRAAEFVNVREWLKLVVEEADESFVHWVDLQGWPLEMRESNSFWADLYTKYSFRMNQKKRKPRKEIHVFHHFPSIIFDSKKLVQSILSKKLYCSLTVLC